LRPVLAAAKPLGSPLSSNPWSRLHNPVTSPYKLGA
jgi:hypothetical protein